MLAHGLLAEGLCQIVDRFMEFFKCYFGIYSWIFHKMELEGHFPLIWWIWKMLFPFWQFFSDLFKGFLAEGGPKLKDRDF